MVLKLFITFLFTTNVHCEIANDEKIMDGIINFWEGQGKFTPFQRNAPNPGGKPWWGPSRMSDAMEYPELRSQLYQGDILVPVDDQRNALAVKKYLWSDATIPYRLAPGNFTTNMTSMVKKAMRILERRTCIKFVEFDERIHLEHIEIRSIPQKGCYAMIGCRPGRKEPLPMNLQYPECFHSIGIIEHELLHVVGLLHEQSRFDRDEHVIVHYDNIDKLYWSEFNIVHGKEVSTFDLPYDHKSIMHYPNWAFSKNGQPTISAKGHARMELGQKKGPTRIDIQKIDRMYNCTTASHYYK